jgi:hypothetical protein
MLKYELRAYAYGTYDHLPCAKAKKKFWFHAVSDAKKIEAKLTSRSTDLSKGSCSGGDSHALPTCPPWSPLGRD